MSSCSKLCLFGLLASGTLHKSFVPLGRKPLLGASVAATAIPLPAFADFEMPDPGLALSVIVVGGACAALSWVAGLRPRKTVDGRPRSTSLYRVFQAKMRQGEFAELSKPRDDEGGGSSPSGPGNAEEELDAFVDAYVDGLENDIEDSVDTKEIPESRSREP